jgi:hypothetical protein
MSMTVIFIRMPTALADEIRAKPDDSLFTALMKGTETRAGFDHKTDIWSDADWRDLDAYTGSDENHPLNQLLDGPIFHAPVSYFQGQPAWVEPVRVVTLFRALADENGFDPDVDGGEDDALVAFEGLVPFLRETVRRGWGLISGVD